MFLLLLLYFRFVGTIPRRLPIRESRFLFFRRYSSRRHSKQYAVFLSSSSSFLFFFLFAEGYLNQRCLIDVAETNGACSCLRCDNHGLGIPPEHQRLLVRSQIGRN